MRIVIQRVRSASVTSEGRPAGAIGPGLLLYIGVAAGDGEDDVKRAADKIPALRIFPDAEGKMNRSLLDVGGEILAVSQFTLLGDCAHGRRPGFSGAEAPDRAEALYLSLVDTWKQRGVPVATGVFRTDMDVSSVNWGPVTFLYETR
ncbi:MAG: D-aminoacyl-tRNA deacylase [Bacillota bacterium]|jgi:D-tyrosyl-tRNA(Tyr) deacylase